MDTLTAIQASQVPHGRFRVGQFAIMSMPEACSLPGLVITDSNGNFARPQFDPCGARCYPASASGFSRVFRIWGEPLQPGANDVTCSRWLLIQNFPFAGSL